ncbi:hypothetical protein [Amycolatopsis pigmentata]|uniref:DUF222 domain-containing protein n=1 Tax=Amycolatopsis pigmentata TaxID=450801 RepID=A0ABW5G0V4_9PSEU
MVADGRVDGRHAALLREMFNLSSPEAQRIVAHAEALCGTVTPTGARIDPRFPWWPTPWATG